MSGSTQVAPPGLGAAGAGRRRRGLPRPDPVRLAPLAGLAVLLVLALVFTPAFYSPNNLANVARQAAILGVVAVGQTFVLLVAGLDLSVGAVIGATTVIAAEATGGRDAAIPLAIAVALLLGLTVGSLNGVLVVLRRVPPFVATLATLILITGVQLAYTRGIPSGGIPAGLRVLGVGRLGPLPVPVATLLLMAAAAAFVLRRTTYGRAVYAVGANPTAARMSGLRVGAVMGSAYVICSLGAVLAGLTLSGYIGYVDRYLGQGFDLDSIAAVVVGGTSLAGGRGGVGGTLIGVALVSVLLNVVVLLDAGLAAQLLVKGAVIVGAVALQHRVGADRSA